ncbi:MAG: chromate transporter [Firmicutes bacterium]|nr:chromate transporter [Bacillota bacterium]
MVLFDLYIAFFKVGAFAVGGAYALVPLIERQVVGVHGWLTREEFLEVYGASAGIPGAISIKMATYTGYKLAGIPGVLAANLGHFTVPCLLMLAIFGVLRRAAELPGPQAFLAGVRAGTWGLLVGFALSLAREGPLEPRAFGLAVPVAAAVGFFRVDPALALVAAGLFGLWLYR